MPNNMAFHTEKDLNSKCQGVKSLYYKDVNTEWNLKSKPKKSAWKRPILWSTLIQAVKIKLLEFLLQNVHLITKYLLPEKFRLLTFLQAVLFGKRPFKGQAIRENIVFA